jgi:hypothetical protein
MKNKFPIILFSLFLSGAARIDEHVAITQWKAPANDLATAEQGKQIAERIIDAVGLKANFEIRAANIQNAAAVAYAGKRYILFNPTFISNLMKTTGTEWAAISVLAHEIGHHLNGHTVTAIGSQPEKELEADEFSGFVLRKMGASLAQAQAAMKTLATAKASYTHPAKYDRLTAIEEGWNHADDQLAGRQTIRKKPAITPSQQTPATTGAVVRNENASVVQSARIIGDVYFHARPSTVYHVTSNYKLVKIGNGSVNVLGKLARLNSNRFPYLIYDEQNTQLLVDRQGNIVTRHGQQVGVLKNHLG